MKYEAIDEATYRILGRGCDCYLLIADEEAIMIDSGCDHENIQEYAQQLTTLPLKKVINTHSHFDHTGGNGYFKEVYISREASKSAKNFMDEEEQCYRYDYQYNWIQEGTFPLQGRPLQILSCDIHSPGNIMILDPSHRLLFTGDEMDHDQVLLLPGFAEESNQLHARPAATVKEYQDMLKRIWKQEHLFDRLCTGHNGSPLDKCYIQNMILCCEEILQGAQGIKDCSSPTYHQEDTHYPYEQAGYLRYQSHGVSLVYCGDDLYERSHHSVFEPATPLHVMCKENLNHS